MKYDRRTSQREFKVGDLVWVATTAPQIGYITINRKFQPKFQGPCRLIEQLEPSTFAVRRIDNGVNLGAINVDRIKKYFEPISNYEPSRMNDDDLEAPSSDEHDEASQNPASSNPTPTDRINQQRVSSRQHQLPARYRD
ncbi:unnamed protein product [Didymodactylos carnosus]|uniref:Uncharacterized protein n=1 Tax=Didymodactylos carnosus TaxID=1234261 RepID=A0A815NH46_9BILA|nr:unnamed protein product [Didymodactylos carnosus]CAF1585774.1 unnamed protein product [Didymodactylos carnosus]CAF4314963.1 unnamed protein product [Didymodactylos carnosus]CAF4387177.1 unnamed protein product [Didymodactylos carnosus]